MKVWDLPTRIYHWLQAILFIGLLASGFSNNGPHIYLGLILFTLVIWRLGWGVIGSETSRFRQFLRSPKQVILYLRGKFPALPGHNPAGGWMVMLMISMLLLQCVSGLIIAGFFDTVPLIESLLDDPVFDAIFAIHLILARLLPVLIAIHLLAILVYKLCSKPLVWAMVSGVQNQLAGQDVEMAQNSRALLVLVPSVLVTIAIIAVSLM